MNRNGKCLDASVLMVLLTTVAIGGCINARTADGPRPKANQQHVKKIRGEGMTVSALHSESERPCLVDIYVRHEYIVYESDLWAHRASDRCSEVSYLEALFRVSIDSATGRLSIVDISNDRHLRYRDGDLSLEVALKSGDATGEKGIGSCGSSLGVAWKGKRRFGGYQSTSFLANMSRGEGCRVDVHALEENYHRDYRTAYDNIGGALSTPDLFVVMKQTIWAYKDNGDRVDITPVWPRKEWDVMEISKPKNR